MMLCMCLDDQQTTRRRNRRWSVGTIGAAEMAQEAGVKELVLVHPGPALAAETPYEHASCEMERIY